MYYQKIAARCGNGFLCQMVVAVFGLKYKENKKGRLRFFQEITG